MRTDRLRLQDILDAIAIIEQYTPADRAQFDADFPVRTHILFHVQVIGEAVSRLSQPLRTVNPQVPWRPIARMRNTIAHVYFGIDWNEVWQVARRDVPALKPQIQAILDSLPPDPQTP
jgi:uncharacterized protein with HEPN domain